jgi:hypothetical protein
MIAVAMFAFFLTAAGSETQELLGRSAPGVRGEADYWDVPADAL